MNNIIAEIGLNHGGDLDVAKALIKQAKDSGCWGVKFQYRDIKSFYKKTDEVGDAIIYDEIKRNFISIDGLVTLSQFCKELSINFGVSLFRLDDLVRLTKVIGHIDFFKIPSAECLNINLLTEIQKTNKKVFVSTGAHSTDEIIKGLSKFKSKIILLHCISNYPTCLGTQDLRVISHYKESGFVQVGYSSHDQDWEVCLIAFSQGAQWIERHITLQKDANGLDHSSSSNFEEIKKLVRFGNEYENVLGNLLRTPNQGELINLQNLGTSLYAKRNIEAGETTSIDDYEIKAPRVGISPACFATTYNETVFQRRLPLGAALSINNFSMELTGVNNEIKNFAKQKKIGLPVRLHDYLLLKNKFDLATYEFHLSYTEVLNGNFKEVVKNINTEENISIHLPDYIPGNNLLDPLSKDKEIRGLSKKIVKVVCNFAKEIEEKISKKVNIVGSFSQCHNESRTLNLDEVFDYVAETNENILPQWLPVYAWYFGGNVKLDIFNSIRDIEYIVSNKCKICLDFSHLVMSASYYNASWRDWFEELAPCVEHMHISDAGGATSEGLMFGEGQIGDFSEILSLKQLKIIESWQGHINEGEGFKQALEILHGQSMNLAASHD